MPEDGDIENLIKIMDKHLSITELDISQNIFSSEYASKLISGLKKQKSLKTLNVSFSCGLDSSIASMRDLLSTSIPLSRIILKRVFLTWGGFCELGKALLRHPNLEYLDISCNPIMTDPRESHTREHISRHDNEVNNQSSPQRSTLSNSEQAKKESFKLSVTHLNMSSAELNPSFDFNRILQWENLVSLSVGDNLLGDDGAILIAQALKLYQPGLEMLDLRSNGITQKGCDEIASLLESSRCMKTLIMSENPLGTGDGDSALRLSEALSGNKALCHLEIANCKLSFRQLELIVGSFSYNSSLTYVDISFNNLTSSENEAGGKRYVISFDNMTHLAYINLSGEQMISDTETRERMISQWKELHKRDYIENNLYAPFYTFVLARDTQHRNVN